MIWRLNLNLAMTFQESELFFFIEETNFSYQNLNFSFLSSLLRNVRNFNVPCVNLSFENVRAPEDIPHLRKTLWNLPELLTFEMVYFSRNQSSRKMHACIPTKILSIILISAGWKISTCSTLWHCEWWNPPSHHCNVTIHKVRKNCVHNTGNC